jgi:Sulfatase
MSAADAARSDDRAGRRGERPARRGERSATRESLRGLALDGAHLAALSALALAQPLFDLLSDNPEFFAARGSPTLDIFVFAIGLVVIPPAVLVLVEAFAGLADRRLRRGLHLTFVALLAALLAVQALKKLLGLPSAPLIVLAALTGIGLAFAYARLQPVESFVTVLSPAPIVFVLLFLFASPVSKLTLASEAGASSAAASTRTPVVMLLLDELPITSLLERSGEIDARRYPSFAKLAAGSTWYRNATGVYDSTAEAIPAILDGRYPEEDKLPIAADHPASLFTLLGESHRMHVSEEATRVCPSRLCSDERREEPFRTRIGSMASDLGLVYAHVVAPEDLERDLPSVSETWGDFGGTDVVRERVEPRRRAGPYTRLGGAPSGLALGREEGFDRFVEGIRPTRKPTLHFLHVLLPHVPWQYLPSGRHYRERRAEAIPGLVRGTLHDQGQVDQAYQRALLQLGFLDRKLGQMIRHLKRVGLYDKSLVVVAADHGITLRRGQSDRRRVTKENIEDVAPVPLFVKAPHQRDGRVDPAYVETVDIVPTIADVLDVEIPWDTDGRSAASREVRERRRIRMLTREYEPIELPAAEFERRKETALARKLALFGQGGLAGLYRIGPHPELLGRSAAALAPAPRGRLRARIDSLGRLGAVDPDSLFVPSHITGSVSGGARGATRDLAVAVNGRIAAVTRSFYVAGDDVERISALVPESALRAGRNAVEVFAVGADGRRFTALSGA